MKKQNKIIRILLIDDDKDDQQFFLQALQEINDNAICDCASSGEEGLKKLNVAEALPDYVFLDLNMPKMDGMQVLQRIKETEKIRKVPVIIYSTAKRYHHVVQAKSLGALEYITKPITITDLINTIRNVVDSDSNT